MAEYREDFYVPDYDKPHNVERKLVVLDDCIRRLEAFQRSFAPVFDEDPLVNDYLARLRSHAKALDAIVHVDRRPKYRSPVEYLDTLHTALAAVGNNDKSP